VTTCDTVLKDPYAFCAYFCSPNFYGSEKCLEQLSF